VYKIVSWSFALKETHTRVRVFEIRVLRKIFRSLVDAIKGGCIMSGILIFISE